jgi:hypothetical protein
MDQQIIIADKALEIGLFRVGGFEHEHLAQTVFQRAVEQADRPSSRIRKFPVGAHDLHQMMSPLLAR